MVAGAYDDEEEVSEGEVQESAKSRAGGTGGANLPPELRGVDLDNLLDGIEY